MTNYWVHHRVVETATKWVTPGRHLVLKTNLVLFVQRGSADTSRSHGEEST